MKLILVIFLVYFIAGIYSQEGEAANNDINVDANSNSTEDVKTKVNVTKTARNYSNST